MTAGATTMLDRRHTIIVFWATWGWIGFSPVAPGTVGSLAALPLCVFIGAQNAITGLLFIGGLILVSAWIAHEAEKTFARPDPGAIVIDEVCGMAVAMWGLPLTPLFVVEGFALFRLFDIIKPFPIRWIEKKVKGGMGIVLDDVVAGLFANILLRLLG